MPRKSRDETAGGIYHVFARGNRKEPIFFDDHDRRMYLSTLGQVAEDSGWRPLAYCLMTNHVHHLVELRKRNLGRGMMLAHGNYARWFNERHQTGGGHLFEKRFGSTRAPDVGSVMYLACYALLNPVRAQMCRAAPEYRWSSCAATLGRGPEQRWVDTARLLEHFGSREQFEQVLATVRLLGSAGFDPFSLAAGEEGHRGPP